MGRITYSFINADNERFWVKFHFKTQQGIHNLMQGKTAIAIAHRLSTIQDVDRIYVLHHGEVCEVGNHDELLGQRGVYWRLYQLQYAAQERNAA